MVKKNLIILFLCVSFLSFGQVGIGQWRDHYCYTNGRKAVFAGNDVYLMASQGLLKYNLNNSEIETISKVQGLSDSKISNIEYAQNYNCLIIGYENGNIDLLKNEDIININDIKQKPMIAGKAINSIKVSSNIAYLATSFGIVLLDLSKKEIKDTWLLGPNGTYLEVNDLLITKNKIYAVTKEGIYLGNLDSHLADFSNWEIISDNNYGNPRYNWLSGKEFNKIVEYKGRILINFKSNNRPYDSDTIVIYDGSSWTNFESYRVFNDNYALATNEEYLLITYWGCIAVLDSTFAHKNTIYITNYKGKDIEFRPQMAVFHPKDTNIIAFADARLGLCLFNTYYYYGEIREINSPAAEAIFRLAATGNTVLGVGGGYASNLSPTYASPNIYKLDNQQWTSFNRDNLPEIANLYDIVSGVIDPNDSKHFFCGTWDHGLLEFKDNKFFKLHNGTNSPLVPVLEHNILRINCLNYDAQENLWFASSGANPAFYCLDKNNKWHSFNHTNLSNHKFVNMLIAKDGTKWVILLRNGLFVFNDNGTLDDASDDQYKFLKIYNELGEKLSENVLSLAEDDDGNIWVGTDNGVAVYYDAKNVFTKNITARQIKVPRNNGTNEADLLLDGEAVSAIVVDAANKKWFGTQNSGAFYTSEDGIEQILNFNVDNSPLPNNFISDITITAEGEVFFATNSGLISYRNLSSTTDEENATVYAFPNPVDHDYDGPIAITGLMHNSYVKITDLSGNLVYETIAEGGQAIWYGKNGRGKRVATGIYFVFITAKDGSKSLVTKILFVN